MTIKTTTNIGHTPTPEHLTHPKYRADIDGLRAIAVLSVVIYHAFPNYFRGGFIGVDIFFVISGFLISTIIMTNLESNSFKFTEFYSRRITRIFPALLLVLIACFLFGWFALFADEYKQLGKHIAGSAGFISNFMFLNEVSYFDNAAETKPLLHLWSLGIEEQFYIVWPLLLWLAWKTRFNLLAITMVVAAISFALNISKAHSDPAAAFYLPQTRFWELLVGSVLAYVTIHRRNVVSEFKYKHDMQPGQITYAQAPETKRKTLPNAQSLVGAILILTGLFVITKERHFPGWWALLPTIGTVLIISAGSHAWFNRVVLSSGVLVWFGLISFPLYLWHWPLLSFAQIVESGTPPNQIRIFSVLVSIALAWLTYKFVEKPIRFGKHRNIAILTLLVFMIIVAFTGYRTYRDNGLPLRTAAQLPPINTGDTLNAGVIEGDEFIAYVLQNFYSCTPEKAPKRVLTLQDRCLQSKSSDVKTIAVIGDSHSQPLFLGLAEWLPDTNIVLHMTLDLPYSDDTANKDTFKSVIDDPNIKVVILVAYWSSRLGDVPNIAAFKNRLVKTIGVLTTANKMVYIADDVPNFSFDPIKCKYSRKFSGGSSCIEDRKRFYDQRKIYFPTLKSISEDNANVKLLEMSHHFCDATVCSMASEGALYYRDNNHLNLNGSKYLGNKLTEDYLFPAQ